jgi:Flp pilus assembly protein TadG
MRSERGQSSVELVGLVPLLLAVGLGVSSLLGAGAASQAAGGAAEAGAVALIQGRDARDAARQALAGWPRGRTSITVRGRRVTVRVTPRGPLGERLRQQATADAGPASPGAATNARPGPAPSSHAVRP